MKPLLLLGALVAAVIVPAATAAPSATGTVRGTVVAKDRSHHALVVALPGGKVQTLVASSAFGRTDVGRKVLIRYSALPGRLPVALGVSLKGHARHAVVVGTVVRLAKRQAIVNAGGSMLKVTLKAPKGQRALAAANDAPRTGDTVKIEVEIDDDGSLDAGAIVVANAPVGPQVGSAGEMEIRGEVTLLSPLTVKAGTPPLLIPCTVPANATLHLAVGDMIEMKCDLIGGEWTVRVAHGEDEHSSGGDDDSSEVKVRGVLSFSLDGLGAIVTPSALGVPVACAIPASVLTKVKAQFAVGDVVKMECVEVGGTPTLKEMEKKGGGSGAQQGGNGDDHNANGDDDDDDNDDDSGDDESED